MTKQEFIKILTNPLHIEHYAYHELQNIVEQYPYFQTARLLAVQKAASTNQFTQLKINKITAATAAQVANRKILYKLVNQQSNLITLPKPQTKDPNKSILKNKNSNTTTQQKIDNTTPSINNAETDKPLSQTETKNSEHQNPLISPSSPPPQQESKQHHKPTTYTVENKPYAIHIAFSKPVGISSISLNKTNNQLLNTETISKEAIKKVITDANALKKENNNQEGKSKILDTVEIEKEAIQSVEAEIEQRRKIAKQQAQKATKHTNNPQTLDPDIVAQQVAKDFKALKSEQSVNNKHHTEVSPSEIQALQNKIDAYRKKRNIKSSVLRKPSMPKKDAEALKKLHPNIKKTEYTDEQLQQHATESIQLPTDYVTETMANIYAKQGNLTKAIEIYHQLMQKFPEKSITFADRIEALLNKQ